ncbi:unnamed protein product [Moneuplotes crassus]|uniref:USP domain-containing protein n=1 Tax=Euplotes crassus TaxID=5936 RepID=A0AAD1X5W8_EUPCR|nr:unnamed protein product [Moneuplotes crassus]
MSRESRAKNTNEKGISKADQKYLRKYYETYRGSPRSADDSQTFSSHCYRKIAKDAKICSSFFKAKEIKDALSSPKFWLTKLELIAKVSDQIELWYKEQTLKDKHEHTSSNHEDSLMGDSHDSQEGAKRPSRSDHNRDVSMTAGPERSPQSIKNHSAGSRSHDNEDTKKSYRAESNSIPDSNNEVINHDSQQQNRYLSGEYDENNNFRNDGDLQGELSQESSIKDGLNYNPFDNEEDCKLPEEEPLLDESKLRFEHPGFKNRGNNCFMIAIVQMLISIPEFVQYFADNIPKEGYRNQSYLKEYQFSEQTRKLIKKVFYENPEYAEVNTLRRLSRKEFPLYRQHDACKYMLHLFENLQNELNPYATHFVSSGHEDYAAAWIEYSKTHDSLIDKLFVGMYETVILCNRCSEETRTYEEFINIPLAIETDERGAKSLEFFENQKEVVSCECHCSKCEDNTLCVIYKRICKAPKFLLLSIQRFDQATLQKVGDELFYPTDFKLELPGNKKTAYDLKTVICHSGSLNDGHYFAYCKRKNEWRCYNDEYVLESDINEAVNEDAYMLVYKVQDN